MDKAGMAKEAFAIMTDRERALYGGHKERSDYGPFSIVLYWEPHYDGKLGSLEPATSFTIDLDDKGLLVATNHEKRWRFRTLADADRQMDMLRDELAVEIAKIAMRLN